MKELNELYRRNVNIMKFLRETNHSQINDLNSILYSYDLQAGNYRENYYHHYHRLAHIDNQPVTLKFEEFYQLYGQKIAAVLDRLGYASIMEVGVGEAVTLAKVMKSLNNKKAVCKGVDISFSRVAYGNVFLSEQGISGAALGVGNMFELPLPDNSCDIVFTSHCIEPNTAKTRDAVGEMYRITRNYLVLIEPSYDLGNEETKKHMQEHAYCTDLIEVIREMNLKVIEHRLFEIGTYNNQAALTIIQKEHNLISKASSNWACPVCKNELAEEDGNYFCAECSLIFPIIKKIPCLLKENGILGSKYLDI